VVLESLDATIEPLDEVDESSMMDLKATVFKIRAN